MVIIPVAREVSFQSFLFKATTFTLQLFNAISKPRVHGRFIIILVLSGACLSKMSVRVMLQQSESASMLSQSTLAQSIEEAISAENSTISIFLSLRKVSSLHDKAGRGKPIARTLNNKMIGDGKSSFRRSKNNIIRRTSNN